MAVRSRLSRSAAGNRKAKASHPSSSAAKIEIRRNVMNAVKPSHVLDAFAGIGTLYNMVWRHADRYTGCDLEWHTDERMSFVCDNRRLLRNVDLQQFNIFDLDAHGSPWEQAWIICHRRIVEPGERIGFVLTEGTGLKLKMGGLPIGLAHMARLSPGVAGLARSQPEIHNRAICTMANLLDCSIVKRWQAESKSRTRVSYIGLVLEGMPAAAAQQPADAEPKKPVRRARSTRPRKTAPA